MDALMAIYASDSDDPDVPTPAAASAARSDGSNNVKSKKKTNAEKLEAGPLPPPPLDLLKPPNSIDWPDAGHGSRIRSFPHVPGNYALHVFIPVQIPSMSRKRLRSFLKKVASAVPGLYSVDVDIALKELCRDDERLEQILLGREFHVSLGRTVPIQVHQIDSIVAMLRQKLQYQSRYSIEFNKWDVFVNDDLTRTFLSLEVTGKGLAEICKQIQFVNKIYKRHGLPEFYEDPRPHISLVWGLGDISAKLKQVVDELNRLHNGQSTSEKRIFKGKFSGIECKIGKKSYTICSFPDQ